MCIRDRYGIEWEQKGTHEKHLSVLDYKKQERAEEIEQLESKIIDKQTEFETLSKRIQNFDKGTEDVYKRQGECHPIRVRICVCASLRYGWRCG